MKKKIMCLFTVLVLTVSLSLNVFADAGPKASVRVSFEGLEGQVCYGTLLSSISSTGPSSAYDPQTRNKEKYYENEPGGEEIWRIFVNYEDGDGFYYLQETWDCSDNDELAWTYHPPTSFKILLYFPESGEFAVSEVCERYAFSSYFSAVYENGQLTVEKAYPFAWELVSLAVRIVLTIVVELAVAWFFGYWSREQRKLLVKVNVATQVLLNVVLNLINFVEGRWAFVFWYVVLEFMVFAVEAFIYRKKLPQTEEKSEKYRPVFYAFVANVLSFVVGLKLAQWIPGIF